MRHSLFLIAAIMLSACSGLQPNSEVEEKKITVERSAKYNDAVSSMKQKKYKKALALFRDVIHAQPNSSNAHTNMGIIFTAQKSLNEAENAFNHALRIKPNNVYALNQLGILYRQLGQFAKAKESYLKAISVDSSYAKAHLNLGILYDLYLYDLPKAANEFKTYLELKGTKDKKISNWILDIERRYKKSQAKK
ncbi:MAG: tetratricopeptide repeat protein [Woeseiaceae bacterium]